ncbi:hypothetical protein BDW62DRAFT_199836 [Aspergillus aurantiobrunneus]
MSDAVKAYYTRMRAKLEADNPTDTAWLDNALVKALDTPAQDPDDAKTGYEISIGVSKDEYYDPACNCVLILHNRATNLCHWYYTVQKACEGKPCRGTVYVKDQLPRMMNRDHYQCEHMTDRVVVDVLPDQELKRFLEIYDVMEGKQKSRRFVAAVLDQCVDEGLVSRVKVDEAWEVFDCFSESEPEQTEQTDDSMDESMSESMSEESMSDA